MHLPDSGIATLNARFAEDIALGERSRLEAKIVEHHRRRATITVRSVDQGARELTIRVSAQDWQRLLKHVGLRAGEIGTLLFPLSCGNGEAQ